MRKFVRILTLGVGMVSILCFVALTALGQITISSSQQQEMKKAPETVTINGKVSGVSDKSLTIVDDQKAEQTIAIDAKTKVLKGGKAATAADLKPEDMVVIVATKGEGNALTAITIKVP